MRPATPDHSARGRGRGKGQGTAVRGRPPARGQPDKYLRLIGPSLAPKPRPHSFPRVIAMLLACVTTTSATPSPSPPSPPPPMLCENTCTSPFGNGGPEHVGNGLCQDGHAGAIGAQCDLGTDCDDCGPREYMPPPQSPPSPPSPPPPSPSPPSPSPPRRHLLRRRCCVRTSASRTRSGMEARTQTTRTARTGASRPSEPAARTARRLHRLRVPISS